MYLYKNIVMRYIRIRDRIHKMKAALYGKGIF